MCPGIPRRVRGGGGWRGGRQGTRKERAGQVNEGLTTRPRTTRGRRRNESRTRNDNASPVVPHQSREREREREGLKLQPLVENLQRAGSGASLNTLFHNSCYDIYPCSFASTGYPSLFLRFSRARLAPYPRREISAWPSVSGSR